MSNRNGRKLRILVFGSHVFYIAENSNVLKVVKEWLVLPPWLILVDILYCYRGMIAAKYQLNLDTKERKVFKC